MKLILILPLLFLSKNVCAQEISKWNIGFVYTIDNLFNVNRLQVNHNNSYQVEFNKFNYTIGIATGYKINPKLKVNTGLLYSNKDFTGTFYNLIPGIELLVYEPETIKNQFLNIPFSVYYSILTTKFRPEIELGINNNFESKNDLNDLSKKYFLEGLVGAYFFYGFSENWSVGIGYKYHTALTDLYKTDKYDLKSNKLVLNIIYNIK